MRIEDMSIDQLLELNQYVCRRIDELRDQENLQALSQLRVGLKVTFEGREGPVLGIVMRIPPYRDRPFRLNVTACSGRS